MDAYEYFDEVYNYHYQHKEKTIFLIEGHKFPYLKFQYRIIEDLTDKNDEEIKIITEGNKNKLMIILNEYVNKQI